MPNVVFSTVEGYFLQDDLETDARRFDFVGYFVMIPSVPCSINTRLPSVSDSRLDCILRMPLSIVLSEKRSGNASKPRSLA